MAETVLVVDDDRVSRLLSRRVLERGGYAVIEAADGAEGFGVAVSDPPALALLDWEMPNLSGLEACQLMRTRPELDRLVVMIMSAHDDDDHRRTALAAGADAYLIKPVEPLALLDRVGELLAAGRTG